MSGRLAIAGAVVLLIGLAYIGGYWPEHKERVALEADVTILQERLADAEAHVRLGRLLGGALHVRDAIASLDYGQAQQFSSAWFDGLQAELSVTPVAAFKTALELVLETRDDVTAALARGDQAAAESVRRSERHLRQALGYPVSASPETDEDRAPSLQPGI